MRLSDLGRSVAGFLGGGRFRGFPARADAGAGLLGRLAGRPAAGRPCDEFKIRVIQAANTLSDEPASCELARRDDLAIRIDGVNLKDPLRQSSPTRVTELNF
jgi:hypothetical protein